MKIIWFYVWINQIIKFNQINNRCWQSNKEANKQNLLDKYFSCLFICSFPKPKVLLTGFVQTCLSWNIYAKTFAEKKWKKCSALMSVSFWLIQRSPQATVSVRAFVPILKLQNTFFEKREKKPTEKSEDQSLARLWYHLSTKHNPPKNKSENKNNWGRNMGVIWDGLAVSKELDLCEARERRFQ